MLPTTAGRVPLHTDGEVNDSIQRETQESIRRHRASGPAAVRRRLRELDEEWDIERTLETNAAAVSLIGLALGTFVDRRMYVIPAMVSAFLLQHALQGWCPPLPIFRRLGFRTQSEIEQERCALRGLQGRLEKTWAEETAVS